MKNNPAEKSEDINDIINSPQRTGPEQSDSAGAPFHPRVCM